MATSSAESSASPRSGWRWAGIFLAVCVVFSIPFLIWGGKFEDWFTGEAAIAWIRSCGAWGGLAVIGLLISDLFLPIPATPVMSAAGYVYGVWLGGLFSFTGSFLAGMLGYGLCRGLGRSVAVRLAGERDLAANEEAFRRNGPWLVALSRWMPLLPEVISSLAGLARMPFATFALALACGSLPLGFVYAAIGASGQEHPRLALALSVFVPPLLWLAARPWLRRR